VAVSIHEGSLNRPDLPLTPAQAAQKRGLRVRIDPRRCIANAKCTTAAPGVYVLDEETGVAVLVHEERATVEQLFAGARACPTQAIIIEQFGRRVFPRILPPMMGDKSEPAAGDANEP
jgi:ferredoxin